MYAMITKADKAQVAHTLLIIIVFVCLFDSMLRTLFTML